MPKRKSKKQVPHQQQRPWQPMRKGILNPQLQAARLAVGGNPADAAWSNDIYQCVVSHFPSGVTHLSIKRHDRHAVHDWRHLQAIKNEICGPEAIGMEVYPPESKLVDSANEYHIWVLPRDHELPFGFPERLVSSDQQVKEFNAGRERGEHKGRQRAFQPGLPVGVDRNEHPEATEGMANLTYATAPMQVKA